MQSPWATQLRGTNFETHLVPALGLWLKLVKELGETHLETGTLQLIYNLGETSQRQWLHFQKQNQITN